MEHRAGTADGEPGTGGSDASAAAPETVLAVDRDDAPAGDPPDGDAPDDGGRAGDVRAGDARDLHEHDEAEWSAPQIVQDAPELAPAQLRIDFGAHLEANYQRLVGQVYAITLDAAEAHDAVQDAYSRAWRRWAQITADGDPTGCVRRVAVRSTQRSWRRVLTKVGLLRPAPGGDGVDPRTDALLAALQRLPSADRRAVVLFHMVGMSYGEIAALEQVSLDVVRARMRRGNHVVTEGMADALPGVLAGDVPAPRGGRGRRLQVGERY